MSEALLIHFETHECSVDEELQDSRPVRILFWHQNYHLYPQGDSTVNVHCCGNVVRGRRMQKVSYVVCWEQISTLLYFQRR